MTHTHFPGAVDSSLDIRRHQEQNASGAESKQEVATGPIRDAASKCGSQKGDLMRTLTRWTCLILLAGSSWGWCQDPGINAGDSDDERIQKLVEERKRREELLSREPTSLDGGETVNPVVIKSITDNSIGIRFEEKDAYFRVLELARRVESAGPVRGLESRRLSLRSGCRWSCR